MGDVPASGRGRDRAASFVLPVMFEIDETKVAPLGDDRKRIGAGVQVERAQALWIENAGRYRVAAGQERQLRHDELDMAITVERPERAVVHAGVDAGAINAVDTMDVDGDMRMADRRRGVVADANRHRLAGAEQRRGFAVGLQELDVGDVNG